MVAQPEPWPAPAKLNLFLHVTARREDGYHLLQSLFQFIELSDVLYFTSREDGVIRHTNPLPEIPPEHDLTVRAAHLLKRHCASPHGVDIRIDKRIPTGGGLGGGSTDAATTLVALNQLWCCGLGEDALAHLGLQLGADVPVFVRGRAAWAEGIGEQLQPVDPPESCYLIIHPGIHISTATIFGAAELTRNCSPITMCDFAAGAGANVCEPIVRQLYPEVDTAFRWLNRHAPTRMTGTGACIFAAFADHHEAEQVLAILPGRWTGFVAKGINRSPLLNRLHGMTVS